MNLLPPECIEIILSFHDAPSLFKCIQVNRYWCQNGVRILWVDPFREVENYKSYKLKSLINALISCIKGRERDLIKKLETTEFKFDTKSSLFNYPSFIKNFDCEKIYLLIRGFVRLIEYKEEKRIMKEELLYDQIIRIIFGNSFSIKVLLRTEGKKRFHNHNSFFSFPFNSFKSEIVYFSLDTVEVSNCTSSNQLQEISNYCKKIKKFKLYLCSSEDNEGISNLIDNTCDSEDSFSSLKVRIGFLFISINFPRKIFNSIRGKKHLVKKMTIDFLEIKSFECFPTNFFWGWKNLTILKITMKKENYPYCLKRIIAAEDFTKLETFRIILLEEEVSSIRKVGRKISCKKNLKDINNERKFNYLEIALSSKTIELTSSCSALSLYNNVVACFIKIEKINILEIIREISNSYCQQLSTLTLEEIKNGFKKIAEI